MGGARRPRQDREEGEVALSTRLAAALLACFIASCGGGEGEPDAADALDAGDDGGAGAFMNPFRVAVDGSGSARAGAVELVDDAGSLVLMGTTVPSLAYEITEWAEYGYTLFHVIAPESDTLDVSYLYCRSGGLTWVWHEDYDLPMDYETATGSCTHALEEIEVPDPGLVPLGARPSPAQLVPGFTIAGTDVSYAAGPGTIRIDGRIHDLYPFEAVDCTSECTADPADGWWELHSLLVDPDGRPCFGVLYLMVADATRVQLGYPVCLEPLEHMGDVFYDAAWTVEPGGGGGSVPAGPRPEVLGHVLRPSPRGHAPVP